LHSCSDPRCNSIDDFVEVVIQVVHRWSAVPQYSSITA
jgi:hypothetical protein